MTLTLREGQVIDGLEVKKLLGHGGMGTVYLVHNPRIRADRALKLISAGELTDAGREELELRFKNEARAGAALTHPNIVGVQDFKELKIGDERLVYLLMEFFPSIDLKAWLAQQPSLDRVLHVGRQLASALVHVHAAGILHRDIKLGNILIGDGDVIKLADFGLAKRKLEDDELTRSGVSIGTKPYFAPEYLRAAQFSQYPQHTELTDLWAVGIVLYYLATGHHPFDAPQNDLIVVKILTGKYAPVETVRSDISDGFAAVIHGLLADDPERRTASAQVLLEQLQAVAHASDPAKPPFVPAAPKVAAGAPASKPMPAPPPGSFTHNVSSVVAERLVAEPSSWSVRADPSASSLDRAFEQALPSPPSQPALDQSQHDASEGHAAGPPAHEGPPTRPGRAAQAKALVPAKLAAPRNVLASLPELSLPSQGFDSNVVAHPPAAAIPGLELSGLAALDAAIAGERQPSLLPQPKRAPTASFDPLALSDDGIPSDARNTASGARNNDVTDRVADAATPTPAPLLPPTYALPPAPPSRDRSALRGIVPAVLAAGLVLGVGGFILNAGNSVGQGTTQMRPYVDPDTVKGSVSAQSELAELKRTRSDEIAMPVALHPAPAAPLAAVATDEPPTPASSTSPEHPVRAAPIVASKPNTPEAPLASASPATNNSANTIGSAPTPAPPSPAAPNPWAERFGQRNLNNASLAKSTASSSTAASTAPAPTAGTRIPVRVDAVMASQPSSPVIAITTAAVKVGDVELPVGTQIHGRTQGAVGPRLLVQFSFALVGGKQLKLQGQALGLDGRAGVVGERSLGKGSDVVGGVATGALQAVSDQVVKAAGANPVGQALQGGLAPLVDKGRKLNNEEDLVTTSKGARFVIYLE